MLPYRLDAATDTPPTPAGPTAGPAARPPAPFPVLTPESLPRLQSLRVRRTPLSQFEVFVCIGNVHGSRNRRQRLHYVLLHSLDEVFDPWIHSAFCKIAIDSPRSTLGWSDYRESLLFFLGDLDGADMYLKECLANDIHDKLGARNKQLLVSLERKEGIGGSEIPHLLKARFTEDQLEDNVTALWNYNRALNAFMKKGDTKSSKKLLAHAINKNSFCCTSTPGLGVDNFGEMFMAIGKENEAGDYTADNTKHWVGVKGALKWLEKTYCQLKNVSPLTTDDECMQLLVAGTRLERKPGGGREGIECFQQLLEILDAFPASNSGTPKLRSIVHQRKAHCHNQLMQYDDALRNYNSAMCFCDLKDKDSIKELFYNRAVCKENQGDLHGSLQDFTFVWERIGQFSTAVEGIQKIEAKLNVQTSVLPPSRRIGGVTESDEVVRRRAEHIARSMPRVDPRETVAATIARCDHCKRSGVALAKCSGRSEAQFCSKECLKASWKAVHKYVCKTSKRRIEPGAKVRVCGLEKAPQHNGKIATIDRFLPDKSRFSIKMVREEDGRSPVILSIRPENLEIL